MNLLPLLRPTSPGAPCGPDPEYSSELAEDWNRFSTERDQLSVAWRTFLLKPADAENRPPNFRPLRDFVFDLMLRTKHLRLAVALTESLVHTEGVRGLRDGLLLMLAWSATWWKELHPGTRETADLEKRADIIQDLNNDKIIKRFEFLPLVEVPGSRGPRGDKEPMFFSLEDFSQASQSAPADPERAQLVRQAFTEGDPKVRQASLAAAYGAREAAAALVALYEAEGLSLSLAKLVAFLDRVIPLLQSAAPAGLTFAPEQLAGAGSPSGETGGVGTRDSAAATLERVIAYFKASEPSSPVPFLLERALRCIGKNYMQLVEELGGDQTETQKVLKPAATLSSDAQKS